MKVGINELGHMNKMTGMAIYVKKNFKYIFLQKQSFDCREIRHVALGTGEL